MTLFSSNIRFTKSRSASHLLVLALALDFVFMAFKNLGKRMGYKINTGVHVFTPFAGVKNCSSFKYDCALSDLGVFFRRVRVIFLIGILVDPKYNACRDKALHTQFFDNLPYHVDTLQIQIPLVILM